MPEVASRLNHPLNTVRAQLDAAGVKLRGTDLPRSERAWKLDVVELQRLYVDEGLPANNVAEQLGVSATPVLRALHRARIPVRDGRGRTPSISRYDALLQDATIVSALRRAKIPMTGPRLAPRPQPLPADC